MSNVWQPAAGLRPAQSPSFEALFSYGFRPFFLGASVFAILVMSVWLAWIGAVASGTATDWLPVAGSPYAWHAHEMILGFAGAAIAGFLLTAVPNWTGALPLSGAPLAALFAVWVAGRLAMAVSGLLPYTLAAGIDLLFLLLLGAFAARQLLAKPALRNLLFLVLLAVIVLANAQYHLSVAGYLDADPLEADRVGLLGVTLMIAVIGGRIVPAFTHNWLHLRAIAGPMPRRSAVLDGLSVAFIGGVLVLKISGAPDLVLGVTALLAAALNGARLAQWRGLATFAEPIVAILHVAYAWLVVGLLLIGVAAVTGEVPESLAFHALGSGAVGTMILAVMSRASLGHTGRAIHAPRPVVWSYILITLATLSRVLGPLLIPGGTAFWHAAAGFLWTGAFLLFVIIYAPILTTPRVHTKVAHP